MSDNAPLKPVGERIVIKHASPGGDDLQNCYFLPSDVDGFYNFYDQSGRTLATGVSSDNPFPFLLDRIAWTIHKFAIDRFAAHGDWRNNVPTITGAQDGTFQAQSEGGLDVDEAEETALPPGAIEIKHVDGGPDKDKLKHCYFLPADVSGEYDLYSSHSNLLKTGLKTDNDFKFKHDSIDWTVTEFKIDDVHAHGHWWNPDDENAQDGTFQAQSEGGMGEEEAASAASGY